MAEDTTKSISDYFPMQTIELIDNQLFIMSVVQMRFNFNKSFQNFS